MNSLRLGEGSDQTLAAEAADGLRRFRGELYRCLTRRADELFELTDALLCTEGSMSSLVGLCLAPEHRRGHGALYDALNHGSLDADRLRTTLAGLALPRMWLAEHLPDARLVLLSGQGHLGLMRHLGQMLTTLTR